MKKQKNNKGDNVNSWSEDKFLEMKLACFQPYSKCLLRRMNSCTAGKIFLLVMSSYRGYPFKRMLTFTAIPEE